MRNLFKSQLKTITVFMLMLWGPAVMGQGGEFRGTVREDLTGHLLGGAHIMLEGTRFGTISDYSGNFKIINIPIGEYTAKVSYIGYETVLFPLSFKSGESLVHEFILTPKPFLAEQAIITANRVQVSRNITPLSVTLVDRKTLENSGESNLLPLLGRQVPGMFVTERGVTGFGVADGAAGNISIRGVGGSPNTQVLVLVDGHPQFMGLFGHPLSDTYIASDAERVEVVRGPASVIYGSNAMGGVINMITHQQDGEGISLGGTIGYGMYNTLKVNGNAGIRKDKFKAFISFNRDQTDGHRENSDFRINNGYAKLSYDLSPHFRVWGDASLAGYNSTNPGPVGSPDTTYKNPGHWQEIFRGFASLAVENTFNKAEGAVKFYYNWGEHKIWDGFLSDDMNYGLMLYQGLKLISGNTLTLGYDYAHYGGKAKNTIPEVPVNIADTSVYEQAVYALVQQDIFSRITLMAGVRFQHHEMYGTEWIPHFGATAIVAKQTIIKASIGKGFRSPTIRELFLFKPANPNLQPEEMWNYEAALQQKLFNNKLSLELTGYYAQGDNLIETTGMFPDVLNTNTGSFTHYGLEFQARWVTEKNLDAMANYSWLHTDKPTLAAPAHTVYLEGNYRFKNLSFRISGQYINQLVTKKVPETAEESYLLIAARVSYTYREMVTFFIDGNNLLNQEYEINYGYPMPGATIFGGVSVKWRKSFER